MNCRFFSWILIALLISPLGAQTWSDDIAEIIYQNCSSCHHEGAIAPFSLMSYQEVSALGWLLDEVVHHRSMPPWPADPNYRHFIDEAVLSQDQLDLINAWVWADMPEGDPFTAPQPPDFAPSGGLLDTIDFTVAIEPYTLQSNLDEYRWFVVENPYDEPLFVKKMEVIPGLENVVHHADISYDLTGNSMLNDLADPLPGFNGSTGGPTYSYYMNAWQPGANVVRYPQQWGLEVPPNSDFVIEIHYGPGGQGMIDSTKMHFQFLKETEGARSVKVGWLLTDTAPILLDGPLVIPADEIVEFHQQSAPLANAISVVSICPHMHFLGKSYTVWYETAEGDSIPLIDIPHWDFHWQKYYSYPIIEVIPQGAVIKSRGVYDNTLDNHDNPNDPPVTVQKGTKTTDEMFLCYFIYTDYEIGDELIVMDTTVLPPPIDPSIIDTMAVTGIHQDKNLWEINISPNPVKDYLLFNFPSSVEAAQFLIFDQKGKLILRDVLERESVEKEIDLKGLSEGIYFLQYKSKGINSIERFVLMH